MHLGVVERLVGLEDGLAVDAHPVLGVVLDLDRQVTSDGVDEDLVEDAHVRVASEDVVLPRRRDPLEVVRRGEHVVPLAPVVDVAEYALAVVGPAEDPNVSLRLADLEHGEELFADPPELPEPRVLVVLVELVELGPEALVREHVAGLAGLERVEGEVVVLALEPVDAEDVLDAGLPLEADEDVVAEQQVVAHDLAMSRGTQLFSVRILSLAMTASSVPPKSSSRALRLVVAHRREAASVFP